MANVNTGELLNFQDYSPEHNDRSARIDVEAVHTNQYNNSVSNPTYSYEEPKTIDEPEAAPQSNHNFWTIEYYQKYFDVQTNEVVERIISSVLPQKVSRNYFDERIKGKPDMYGPIWISVTLIFTIAVSGNISNYLQNANKALHWRYDFHLVSYAATAIVCYVWLVPLALWGALKWTTVSDNADEIETQRPTIATVIPLFCLYGYSLSIYIPMAVLWIIPVFWLQWLLALITGVASGAVLVFWLLPTLERTKYVFVLVGAIIAINILTSATPSMISLFCLYGYSLSIYIPVAVMWTIQVSWLQWMFVLMAAFVSGAVLVFWLMPALRKSRYFIILVGSIIAVHFLLAAGFMLYFFHVPAASYIPSSLTATTTVVSVN